jgi:predicted transcriptional regulator
MADEALLALAADIISAHVSNNSVSADQLPQLIVSVYGSLASLGQEEEPVQEQRTPAVSVRSSVKPDGIVCLECGKKFKTIKRHLTTDHGLSVEEYRQRWNLPASYPVVSSEYAERRRELAKTSGLGRKKGSKNKTVPAPAAGTKSRSASKNGSAAESDITPGPEAAPVAEAKVAAKLVKAAAPKKAAKPRKKAEAPTG